MEQCMLFFDIDGTLITEDARRLLPASAKKAVRKARANGHLTFINTGRSFINVGTEIRNIGFDGLVCGCGTYIHYNDKPLFHNILSKELCNKTALFARECKMNALFESAGKNGIDPELPLHPKILELKKRLEKLGRPINDYVGMPDFSFDKFTGWFNEDCQIQKFKDGIKESFDYIHRDEGFCEIIPRGFSKASGIDYLCKHFHIPLERCYAFGDSTNDLSMLMHVPNSIGMSNGMSEVLDVVSYVTDTVENDGLYKAMEHFRLI